MDHDKDSMPVFCFLDFCKKIFENKNAYKIIRFNVIDSTNPHVLSYQYGK